MMLASMVEVQPSLSKLNKFIFKIVIRVGRLAQGLCDKAVHVTVDTTWFD
jgi:hypothetical protein